MSDHYETLGVSRDASKEEIKKAHRKKVKAEHPDAGGDPEKFMLIQIAYEVLTDDERRERYDKGEPDPPSIIQEAFTFVANMFKTLIDKSDESMICVDIVGRMVGIVAMEKDNVKKQVRTWEKRIKLYEQMTKRLTFKGNKRPNILTGLLNRELQGFRNAIKQAEKQIEMLTLATEIIKEYEFEPESPMTSNRAANSFTQKASFGGPFFTQGW